MTGEADKPNYQLLALLALGLVILAVLVWVRAFVNLYVQRLLVLVAINIMLAISLNLSSGFTGVFSLGHVGFMAIGAYVSALFTLPPSAKVASQLGGLPGWLAALDMRALPEQVSLLIATTAGVVVAVVVAVLVSYPLMRLQGHYVAVATMGFLIIVHVILLQLDTVTRGARGLSGIPSIDVYWTVWVWVILSIYVIWRTIRSPFGRGMIAVRENILAAQSIGVDVLRTRMLAFCVGAAITAVAGALKAHLITAISPSAFYFDLTFTVIIMVVIGGMGSLSGSIMMATLLTFIPEFLRTIESGVSIAGMRLPEMYGASQITMGVFFIVVIIFRRQGLMGTREIDLGGALERIAKRLQPQQAR
jgi:branched-chain amino acid transport system permease protein